MFTFQFLILWYGDRCGVGKVCALLSVHSSLFIYWYVCMDVFYQLFSKTTWTELLEIFRGDLSSSKDQSIRFWERSDQRSRSRSRKGLKNIFLSYELQCQNVHFSIPYPLIWWQMWRWRRYALYRVVCMYVCMYLAKGQGLWTEGAWNLQGWFVMIQGPSLRFLIRSKVKVKVRSWKIQNYSTKFHEIFRDDLSSSKDQLIRFWERSGQRWTSGYEKVKNVFLS